MVEKKDLISRCELFNKLATIPAPPEANEFKAKIYEVIQGMETTDRPQGEWIEVEEDWRHQIEFWKCSECDFAVSSRYNFFPNCGCRMKGADDEIATV